MKLEHRAALLGALVGLASACGESPGLPAAPCAADRDCEGGRVCGPGGFCAVPEDPRVPVGGGVLERVDGGAPADAPDLGPEDAGAPDFGPVAPDLGPLDAGASDLGPVAPDLGLMDGGATDLGGPDLGPADLGPSDGGAGDGGAGDAGAPGSPVPRGSYRYTRVLVPGLSSTQGLWRVALAPDDRTLVAAEHGDSLFVVDRATETLVREIVLPRSGADAVRVGDVAYAPGRDWLLVAATATYGSSPTGRIYRVEPRAGTATLVGSSPSLAFERIVFRGTSSTADVAGYEHLGGGRYLLALLVYDDAGPSLTLDELEPVAAGCEGLARADDGLGATARVYACGIGGGDIGHVDATGSAYGGPGVGNVSHLDARPSGDYALAVGWASARLLRFERGTWTTGRAAPDLGTARLAKIEMADDGRRALVFGAYDRTRRRAELREYRHGAYQTAGLSDVSIPGFDRAPWFGVNGSGLFDAAWRPGCDAGYLVGGCGGPSCGRGWIIRFEVTNGRPCP